MSTNLHEFTLIFRDDSWTAYPSLIKRKKGFEIETLYLGDPPEARTQDPHIKSVMLYLLS